MKHIIGYKEMYQMNNLYKPCWTSKLHSWWSMTNMIMKLNYKTFRLDIFGNGLK